MNKFIHSLFFLTILITFWSLPGFADQDKATASSRPTASTYLLGPGDTIKIQVFGEPEMGLEGQLSDSGTIVHPLLGEMIAAGHSIGELTEAIVQELKGRYLVDPKVSINIVEYRDYYITGEVKKPGAYHYEPGLNVHKAISVAGGFTQRASRTSIYLIKDKDPSRTEQEVDLNTSIGPGDILTVEESFF